MLKSSQKSPVFWHKVSYCWEPVCCCHW